MTDDQMQQTTAEQAEAQADALNSNLLSSQQERNLASLQEKNRDLTQKCTDQESQNATLQTTIEELRSQLDAKEAALASASGQAESELKMRQKAEEREKDVNERMARIDVEADSLRQEIR